MKPSLFDYYDSRIRESDTIQQLGQVLTVVRTLCKECGWMDHYLQLEEVAEQRLTQLKE